MIPETVEHPGLPPLSKGQQQSQACTSRSPVSAETGPLHASPRHTSTPSRTAKTTITSAAAESAWLCQLKVAPG
jgi:hypothetical protein